MTSPNFESNRQRILRVQLHIEEHLDQELPLAQLADVAYLSPYHFHRIFRATVGEGVAEYVRRVRLERSAIALKATTDDVTKIAFDAQYGSHEAFTRAFRRQFGMSPSEFRIGTLRTAKQIERSNAMPQLSEREVRTEFLPATRVAFLRHIGPYSESGPTFQKMMCWAFEKGLFNPRTKVLSICHDDPAVTPGEKQRLDCCVSVDSTFLPEGDVAVQEIPKGEYVIMTHHGEYSGLADSYCWLYGKWLATSGREFANRPPFEVYLNNPADTPPGELLTEICILLKPQVG